MTMSTNHPKVGNFDPARAESSSREWLDSVEAFARRNSLAEDQTYSFARGKLRGSAKTWFKRAKVSSWKEFQQAFVLAFPADNPISMSRDKRHRTLGRRKKFANETVEEYIEEMLKLGKLSQLSEEVIVSYIVAGLRDPVLSKAIPYGVCLEQLKKGIQWQRELGALIHQYHNDPKVTVDDFERLADRMEQVVLWETAEQLRGDPEVLRTVGNELSSLLRQHRVALSCNLSNLGTSKTHQLVVRLNRQLNATYQDVSESEDDQSRSLQTSLISHLTCDVIQKSSHCEPMLHRVHLTSTTGELLPDLAHLNASTCRQSPSYFHAKSLLQPLAGFRYFTTLDFNAGHFQIPLEPGSRRYFTFRSGSYGIFQYRRAPKHFANTTIVFNKILIELARKLPTGDVVVLNDVLILPSRDTPEGLQKLARVFAALAAFGLTADVRRSRFFERRVQLYNWIVQQGKVISNGLPFEMPVRARSRLVLVVRESCSPPRRKTPYESLLQQRSNEYGQIELVGSYTGQPVESKERNGGNESRLAVHLVESIEHFRQFLLFAPFEVLLEVEEQEMEKIKGMLLDVQQYNFELKTVPRD
uniref:Retrotransposon gag domain-containing protein n=1 Tax=Anopheles farauti TaxID=69004 RepID=A0A182QRK3_9DIPT